MCYSTGVSGLTWLSVCSQLCLVSNCCSLLLCSALSAALLCSALSALVLYCTMPFIATCVDAIGTVFWDRPMLTSSGGHQTGWYASYWNVFLLPSANKVCEGYVFTCFCHSVHGGSASVHGGIPKPPWDQAPPSSKTPRTRHPRTRYPFGSRLPLLEPGTPLGAYPPETTPPLHSACWEIRSTSGRCATYWNAILLIFVLNIRAFNTDIHNPFFLIT